MFPSVFIYYLYTMSRYKEYLTTQTLIFPLFDERVNGELYVTKGNKIAEKLYIVLEIGLFVMPVQELTHQQIKAKYGVKLPKDFLYDQE